MHPSPGGRHAEVRYGGNALAVGGVVWGGYSSYQTSTEAGEDPALAVGRGAVGVTSAAAGAAAGIWVGGATGAAVGSVFPVVGTAVGFVVGLGVGALTSYVTTEVLTRTQDAILDD